MNGAPLKLVLCNIDPVVTFSNAFY